MTDGQWQAVWALVESAQDLPRERWRTYLQTSTGDAEAIAGALRILEEGDAMQSAAALPTMIGPYRILRRLAEGGMGVVYEAEQAQPRRVVALKVIKPGCRTLVLLRRFEREAQMLGRLQHPGIAQIYEAGTAEGSFGQQPWIAMEFVNGRSLLDFADAHRLDVRERLSLMKQVCEAVQHAHEQGIIHRDLKPANILVTVAGQPKILDFGVARLAESESFETRQTGMGELIGTLAYMSPEQVAGDSRDIDTRSDIYSLGVILYELLAGRLPYDVHGRPLHESACAIRQDEPAPLHSVNRIYRGDIETIVAKALEKEKSRRYASAAALAEDLARYLNDEPIAARPATAGYQLHKFARRNRSLVLGAAAVIVALVAGTAISVLQAMRAAGAEKEANAVNAFLQDDLLAQASANVQASSRTPPDPELKVRTALDRAAEKVGTKFHAEPAIEASIRHTIGTTYLDMGLFAPAEAQLVRAIELRKRTLGARHPATLNSMDKLAESYRRSGQYPRAEQLQDQVLALRRKTLGDRHPDTLSSMHNLAALYRSQGKFKQSEQLYVKVVELRSRVLGERNPDTLASMNNLGLVYLYLDRFAQSEQLQNRVAALRREVLGERHPDTLVALSNLGIAYYKEGKNEQAEKLFPPVVEGLTQVLGPAHSDTLSAMNNLANVYSALGKFKEAEKLCTLVLETRRKTLGSDHPDTLVSMNNLADDYNDDGDYARAEKLHLYAKVIALRRRILGPRHPNTMNALAGLAHVYTLQSKYSQAEQLHTEVSNVRRQVLGPHHQDTLDALTFLGEDLVAQRKFAEAEPVLREALANADSSRAKNWMYALGQSFLGASLAGQRKYEEAEPLLAAGRKAVSEAESLIPADLKLYVRLSATLQAKFSIAKRDVGLPMLTLRVK